MSKLDDLIKELCPNGVEWRKLDSMALIVDGTHQTPQYTESGVKFVSVENINDLYGTEKYISEEAFSKFKIVPQVGDVLMTRIGSIGICTVVDRDEPLAYYVSLALLRPNQEILNSRYLKYVIESKHGRKELRKRTLVNAVPIKVNTGDIGMLMLPVPPLEVQREIVQILDKFTLLSAELSAELSARRKQYAYYVDKMFNDENVEIRTLDEVAEIIDSLHATPKYTENGYSMIRVADIKGGYVDTKNALKVDDQTYIEFIKRYKPQFNDIIVSRVGSFGNFSLVPDEDICLGQNVALIHPKINNKYLYYYLNSFYVKDYIEQKAHGGGYKNIGIKDLMKIPVKLHTEEEQEKIARILEKFDVINSNMDEGIPAEIEARRKQYEYYRDKLLSFKKR